MNMINTIRNSTLFAVAALLFPVGTQGQTTTLNYAATSEIIANPERGWCDFSSTHSGGTTLGTVYRVLDAEELARTRTEEKVTLIWRIFHLHQFLETDQVSQEYLDNMQADFDSIRKAGIKCIVRFSYSNSQSADPWDAPPERVFSHIQSLSGVLAANSDVIATVQAGFIGAWGEWYYTKNWAGQGYVPDETDQQNRRLLVEKLLDILPPNITVETRTPAIIKNIVGTTDPISAEEAFTDTYKARTGHHNDCFLASASDYGTYTNLEADLAYLEATTSYTITGGETCDGSNQYSDCVNGVPRMELLHWTYLNRDYNRTVYDKWKEQGCYDEIDLRLGYRISLESAVLPDSAGPGDEVPLAFTFINTGFAAPTQPKPVSVVLINTDTQARTLVPYTGSNSEIRFWLPGEIQLEGSILIPDTLAQGNYTMELAFPDMDPDLAADPAYSIRLANAGLWDAQNGTNRLGHVLIVGSAGEETLPEPPAGLAATAESETEISLTWTDRSDNETGFEIMRAMGDHPVWEQAAITGPDTESYTDSGLTRGRVYHYMVRALNDLGASTFSDSVTVATLGLSTGSQAIPAGGIFPNPLTGDELVVRCGNTLPVQVRIYDLSGQCVYEASSTETEYRISRNFLYPGQFVVVLDAPDGSSAASLVVL
ncbi:MAG: DUF4832 domain-containing protein [Bacteroidales bacterium]